jgi:hypothetical protein
LHGFRAEGRLDAAIAAARALGEPQMLSFKTDLLEIEREVARVREAIDQLEGRIGLWDSQIAMSSLVITLNEPAPIVAGTGGPLRTLIASFTVAGENFVRTVAELIAISGSALPVMLLLAGPAWLVARAWRRTRARTSYT